MSLPASQQRVLDSMEGTLRASEPRLYSMFVMFGRLNAGEPVGAEPLARPRPQRRLRWLRAGTTIYAFVLVPIMFAMITIGALLSSRTHAAAATTCGYSAGGGLVSRQWCQQTIQKTTASGARLAACAARITAFPFVTRSAGQSLMPPWASPAVAGAC